MSKILVIIESPGKCQKIEHILGKDYKVMATYGHIMDIEPSLKSIDIQNKFTPKYQIQKEKADVVNKLRAAAKGAKDIIISSDPDREGEMIAWSVAKVLNLKNPKRVTFNEITKKEVTEAIKTPRELDQNLINAQKTRRILDMLVGFELSPLLLRHMGQGNLSAGRVQSVAIRVVVDKENEISAFMSKPFQSFFKVKCVFLSDNKPFSSNLYDLEGTTSDGYYKGSMSKIDGEDNARGFLNNCILSTFKVAHVFEKKRTQGPAPPFMTASLQQEANKKLGFKAKRTMTAAQHLYEAGYITYMRTDSVNLSEESMENIKQYVVKKYGANHYRKVEYKSKGKHTQEAHEAVRPCDVNTEKVNTDDSTKLGSDEIRLYNLIWKRTVASQMKPAEYDVTSIQISISKEKDYFFMTNIENLTFAGFLSVYNVATENKEEETEEAEDEDQEDADDGENKNKNIKIPKVGTELTVNNIIGNQDYVRPPGRYNEASLLDKLGPKNLNIGRPGTFASLDGKILERNYVKVADVNGKDVNSLVLSWDGEKDELDEETNVITLGKEKGKYIPTHLGILVTNFLLLNFEKVMDYQFTALMEEKLDDIAAGNAVWSDELQQFYDEFHPNVEAMMAQVSVKEDKHTRLLGQDPETGFDIYATIGPHTPIVKLMREKGKPKFAPIKEPLTLENITLEEALELFEYPKDIGKYGNKKLILKRGEFGLYLTCGEIKITTTQSELTQEEAIKLIQTREKKSLGSFSDETKTYNIYKGKDFITKEDNHYISIVNSKTNKKYSVTLPDDEDIENITLERINQIIKEKYDNKNKNTEGKANDKTPVAKKAPVKKIGVKKAVIKKAAKKKIYVKK